MKKSAFILFICFTLLCASLSGCSQKISLTTSSESSSEAVSSDRGAQNPITGEYNFDESAVGTRPYAIMVSNIKIALPQYGIGSADMCYEVLAEGGITRIMAVFADKSKVAKTGPVRSVRDYYVDLAEGINAILVHFGGSPKGYEVINSYGTDDIDGMTASAAFEQDTALAASKGREHSFFTRSKLLTPVLKNKKYKTSQKDYTMFKFAAENSSANMSEGVKASSVSVSFSGYCTATFEYNKKTKKYLKGQFGEKHIDNNTKKQISVKNVFVLKTSVSQIAGDKSGRIKVDLSSGEGKYISNGKMIDIKWKKGDHDSMLKYYTEDGSELKINRGKSWVCIIPEANSVTVK